VDRRTHLSNTKKGGKKEKKKAQNALVPSGRRGSNVRFLRGRREERKEGKRFRKRGEGGNGVALVGRGGGEEISPRFS